LEVYGSVKEAAAALNLSDTAIRHCLSGKHKSAGGYYWKEENKIVNFVPTSINTPMRKSNSAKTILQFDLDGNYIQSFSSLSQANIAMRVSRSGRLIKKVCEGEKDSAYGYKWKYGE
jgi:hypothetical protein